MREHCRYRKNNEIRSCIHLTVLAGGNARCSKKRGHYGHYCAKQIEEPAGETIKTPSWCPLTKPQEAENDE